LRRSQFCLHVTDDDFQSLCRLGRHTLAARKTGGAAALGL
jgi:hypothetical protein